jgi:hypothetical protein
VPIRVPARALQKKGHHNKGGGPALIVNYVTNLF